MSEPRRDPYTRDERTIMDLLIDAHNKFIVMGRCHPSEVEEWIISFHRLQEIINHRVLVRDYPGHFSGTPVYEPDLMVRTTDAEGEPNF